MGNRFIPPPPVKSPPDNANHLRTKSTNSNTPSPHTGMNGSLGSGRGSIIPTANAMSVNDDMKSNHFAHPPPPTSPPPPANGASKTMGFGVDPRYVQKKKRTLLPNNGLDEKEFYKKYWIEAGKIGEFSILMIEFINKYK